MNVSYTAYGLVKEVRDASNNLMLSYIYDDRGNRIIKTIYSGGSATKSTYYVHDAEGNVLATYDQTLPGGTPQLIEVPIYGSGRIALYKPAVNTYFYELNDHLGNVKAVIGQPQTVVYTATMETETAATEDAQFKNIAPRTVYVAANNTPGGNEAVRINNGQPNGGFSGRIGGPGISLKVMPGDVISAEVYGYYEGGSGYSSTLPASTLIAAASGIFGGVNGAPGDPGKIFSAFNQAYGGGFAGGAGSTNDLVPAAYLNMIMFDANMGVDPANLPMAAVSITSAANGNRQKISIGPITIPAPGYVYIYLDDNSNSPNWVYFDDLKVTHVQSPFVAGGDFYPFGLTMDDRQMTRESYRYGYQGQYAEKDATTGWNEFELRMYEPRFGRWLSADPYGQYASPYVALSNNPAGNVDPDGGFSGDPIVKAADLALAEKYAIRADRIILQDGFKIWTATSGLMIEPMNSEGFQRSWSSRESQMPRISEIYKSPDVNFSFDAEFTQSPVKVPKYGGELGDVVRAGTAPAGEFIMNAMFMVGGELATAGVVPLAGYLFKAGKASLLANRTTRIYRIMDDQLGTVYKYGISSGALTKSGRLPRLQNQLNKLNKISPGRYSGNIMSVHGTRAQALFYENIHTAVYKETMGVLPTGMSRPSGVFPFRY